MNYNRNQRFKMICAVADKIVEETGVSPSEVSGYAVSMAVFNRKPNGDFYALFDEWLKLRRAVPGAPPVDMPAEAAAELDQWADHVKAQIMQRVTGIMRGVAGSFEQTTALRVTALERIGADQFRRNQEVLDTLVETEAELETARASIAALTGELQQERDQMQRLLGRLDERDAQLQQEKRKAASECDTPTTPVEAAEPAEANAGHDAGTDTEAALPQTPAVSAAQGIAHAGALAATLRGQPSAIETNRPTGGQDERLTVINDAADKADGVGDDHG